MNKDNKNENVDNTDKKLHISDVSNSATLNIDDYVTAIKDANYFYHPDEYFVLKGKKYKVISLNEPDEEDETKVCFMILDESGEEHLFGYEQLDKNSEEYLFDISA